MNAKWKRWSRLPILVALCVGATQVSLERAAAIEVLDQYQENWENGFSLEATPRVTQTFRPVFGNVTAISALLTGPAEVTIRLFDALCGNLLATGTKSTDVAGWVKVNFPAPIMVVAEAEYAIEITGTYPGPTPSWFGGIQRNPYARGALYLDCSPMFDYDATFRTYSEDGLVPVVASPWGEVKNLYR